MEDEARHTVEILDASECLSILRAAPYGRLGVVVDGAPDVFPINHVVDHGSVVFRTAQGTKLAASVDQLVAFEVDGRVGNGTVWSVVVRGRARLLQGIDEAIDVGRLNLEPWHRGKKPVVVRIEPVEISGRRFSTHG